MRLATQVYPITWYSFNFMESNTATDKVKLVVKNSKKEKTVEDVQVLRNQGLIITLLGSTTTCV